MGNKRGSVGGTYQAKSRSQEEPGDLHQGPGSVANHVLYVVIETITSYPGKLGMHVRTGKTTWVKQLEVKVSPGPVLSSLSPRRTQASSRGGHPNILPSPHQMAACNGARGAPQKLVYLCCRAEIRFKSNQKKEKFGAG